MTTTVTITLPGVPRAKGRPRFTKTGRAYTDAKTAAAEQSVLAAWLTQAGDRTPHDGPVTVRIEALFPVPESWPKWKRLRAVTVGINNEWPHMSKPDLDNIAKLALDGLNGVAWVDDGQIGRLVIEKRYGSEARLFITCTFHPMPTKGD